MKCPYCNADMKEGFLFGSKDGAFSFANEVPGSFKNARSVEGFVEITPLRASHRISLRANLCEACRKLVLGY